MQIPRSIRYLLLAVAMSVIPASSFAGVVISVGIAPPVLPVYTQPACPGDGYIWTPGYWAYGDDGYYWVPGTWVLAPEPGFLWTPGYWGWGGSAYIWHAGYWGPHVGFYGGINYGFGYFGAGYEGGYWRGREFFYNRSVNNVTITNVHIYNRTVNNVTVNRVSFNGGHGGLNARPRRDEERWAHERHFEATHTQMDHEHAARGNREFLASVNHGRPAIAATARPGEFHGRDVAPARDFRPAEGRPMNRRAEGRAMDRPVPHPDNSARNMDRSNDARMNDVRRSNPRPNNDRPNVGRPNNERPMQRQENSMNRGGRPEARPENHGQGQSRPAGHESAPHSNPAPHGNPQHGGGNEQHGHH